MQLPKTSPQLSRLFSLLLLTSASCFGLSPRFGSPDLGLDDVSALYRDAANLTGRDWPLATLSGPPEAQRDVCRRMVTSAGGEEAGAAHLRSTCPWHYEEAELPAEVTWPRRLLRATLTCGPHCLRWHEGQKKATQFPCRPVTRSVSVWRCEVSATCGRQACHQEFLQVPVAFTCAFPSISR